MSHGNAGAIHGLTPILCVSDFGKSVDYYVEKLGFKKAWDWGDPPTFGCVVRDSIAIFLCLRGQGQSGTWMSLFVQNADVLYDEMRGRGADIIREIQDEPWGMREFHVRDPDGHVFRIGHSNPAKDMKVERVDLGVRIEKRLAGVLTDLADASRRSPGELLEEILLHSFEPVPGQEGQAVASPYMKSTFEVIDKLKKKHGLDYETHDNARFTEK